MPKVHTIHQYTEFEFPQSYLIIEKFTRKRQFKEVETMSCTKRQLVLTTSRNSNMFTRRLSQYVCRHWRGESYQLSSIISFKPLQPKETLPINVSTYVGTCVYARVCVFIRGYTYTLRHRSCHGYGLPVLFIVPATVHALSFQECMYLHCIVSSFSRG